MCAVLSAPTQPALDAHLPNSSVSRESAYPRRTKRCASQLQTIGLMLGGNAGARLAEAQGIPVSSDTLLRLVRATDVPERSTPEVLGVDDFALRKGVKYGTILLNLERHCLVDLLPDREKATVAAWLKLHPGVKMVSRDRGGAYARSGARGRSTRNPDSGSLPPFPECGRNG